MWRLDGCTRHLKEKAKLLLEFGTRATRCLSRQFNKTGMIYTQAQTDVLKHKRFQPPVTFTWFSPALFANTVEIRRRNAVLEPGSFYAGYIKASNNDREGLSAPSHSIRSDDQLLANAPKQGTPRQPQLNPANEFLPAIIYTNVLFIFLSPVNLNETSAGEEMKHNAAISSSQPC